MRNIDKIARLEKKLAAEKVKSDNQLKEISRLHSVYESLSDQARSLHGVMDAVMLGMARQYGSRDKDGTLTLELREARIEDLKIWACHTVKSAENPGYLTFTAMRAKENGDGTV